MDTAGLVRLGDYIRQRRGELGLTQRDVGEAIGRDQGWISNIERGVLREWPNPENIRRLADVLETSSDRILRIMGYVENQTAEPDTMPTIYTLRENAAQADLPDAARRAINDILDMVEERQREREQHHRRNGTA